MKKILTTIGILFLALISTNETYAQKFADLDKSPMDVAAFPSNFRRSDKVIKITYSRPQLKGRNLSDLAPNEKVWRTGANEATEITFYKDVTFGDKEVKAGTYSMFSIPGEKEWTIILSSQLNVWGSYFYKKESDVARVTVPVNKHNLYVDAFSIAIDDDMTIHLGWGNIIVSVPVK